MPWTNVTKPTESSITTSGGTPFGLLMALTSADSVSSVITGWTNITKTTSSTWTLVAKPTSSTWTLVAKPTD